MAVYEGRWICKQCGSENFGSNEVCNGTEGQGGCGKSRPKDVEFYLPENSPIITDKAQLADATSGSDWHCDHCEGANKNAYSGHRVLSCVHCGNSRDSSDTDHKIISYTLDSVPRRAKTSEPIKQDNARTRANFLDESRHTIKNRRNVYVWSGLATLVLFSAVIWYFFFASIVLTAHVESLPWSRSVFIEKYQSVRDEGWDLPATAKDVRSERRVHHHDRLVDHYENKTRQVQEQVQTGTEKYVCGKKSLGNGYFEDVECSRPVYRSVSKTEPYREPVYYDNPVYATWYTFSIMKWVYNRKHDAAGLDHEVYWPPYQLGGDERVSNKKELYTIHLLTNKNTTKSHEMSFTDWQKVTRGQAFRLEVNRVGSILSIKMDKINQ